ncbi:MAG: hypothetical protein PVS3B2_16750 [Candidatus Dormibacteraceae bacterium]
MPTDHALNTPKHNRKGRPILGNGQLTETIDRGIQPGDFNFVIRRVGHWIHPTNACLEVNVVNNPHMKVVADSFSWPFRGDWKATWLPGVIALLLVPIAFVPLLGYAVAATRAAEENPTCGPPRWSLTTRLLTDGFWTSLVLLVLTFPFSLALNFLAARLDDAHLWHVTDVPLSHLFAQIVAALILALPWGLLLLLHMPHATARFARTGKPLDMFNVKRSIRLALGRDFATWNLAAAAIVTGWAIGLACAGLLCVGLVPGIFYAILVSAHASAVLEPQAPQDPKDPKGTNSPAR